MTAAAEAAAARATPAELRRLLRHRAVGAALLSGEGLEIGALHYPLAASGARAVQYLDVEDGQALRAHFPELGGDRIVEPRWVGDIVRATVPAVTGRHFDFIVMNHVLEHVANPIQALANIWAGLGDGGLLVLSVPDKHFTYDRSRRLTDFEHLLQEFRERVTAVDDSHYIELLEALRPEVCSEGRLLRIALGEARQRREHAHVWDSESFRSFWQRSAHLLGLDAALVYESSAASNQFEYFAVLRRSGAEGSATAGSTPDLALRVLAALYGARADLQRAFPAVEPGLAARLLTWATTAGASVDSDAGVLRAFQDSYTRLLDGGGDHEETLRAALDE